ncbi:MAG TPA: hypothetical protein P5527_11985 [Kiritimatiellia bacterium]|nr:hypothetical protein [Kiritimatiellia bacterium]
MRGQMRRRDFLRLTAAGSMGVLASRAMGDAKQQQGARWYRGNLHMHTYWSDGRAFPEQAISIYKALGYDFISLSEHNVFADQSANWRTVEEKPKGWPPQVGRTIFDAYMKEFGNEAETRTVDDKTQVRLKTYDEMRSRFEEPGKFLLMPGVEITQHLKDEGVQVHMNYINLPDVIPFVKGGPLNRRVDESGIGATEVIGRDVREVAALAAQQRRRTMLMLNHPQWIYWDIMPQHLIDNPEVRHFEVCNGGSSFAPHPEALSVTNDRFWDTINAFRSLKGAPLLFGVGTDDTHYYINRTPDQRLADAWVMVRSKALEADALMAAMDAGDYYATTGVLLDEVAFDASAKSLHVKVQAAPGVKYRINFITTRRGFDQSVRTVHCPAVKGRGARTLPVYSDDIGKIALSVEGTEATYRMKPDDLYVRAKIESDVPSGYKRHFHPDVLVAWTQPHR